MYIPPKTPRTRVNPDEYNPHFTGHFPWGALARLGLRRAYALQGNAIKSRAAYQDLLTLSKDADSNIPILQQAKAENAKLQ
jgi:hypothetical protein